MKQGPRWKGCQLCRRSKLPPEHEHCPICGAPVMKNHRSKFCDKRCRDYAGHLRLRRRSIKCKVQLLDGSGKKLTRWIPRRDLGL